VGPSAAAPPLSFGASSVFRTFRDLTQALQGLRVAIVAFTRLHQANAPADARLEELERSRAMWEADMTALMMKAEGKLKASLNAESRARTMEKHVEKHLDPFDPDIEEPEATEPGEGLLPVGHVEAGPEDGLLAMSARLEGPKSNALRRKFF